MNTRMFKAAALLLTAVLLGACQEAAVRPVISMDDGVTPLSGIEPTLPDDELHLFDELAKSATIIALGEVAHGSAGLLKLEHRLTKYFVEKHGYRLVMLESPVIRSVGLTRWVAECPDRDPPIDLYPMPVQEDLAFINWICDFNRKHPNDPVRFRGMDIWDRPWEHQGRMETLALELGLDLRVELKTTRQHCWVHDDSDWDNFKNNLKPYIKANKKILQTDYVPCAGALNTIRNQANALIKNETDPDRLYRAYTFLQSVDTALGFQGYHNYMERDFGDGWNSRDLAQSRNEYSIWMQEGKKKAVIIGHTTHTAKMSSQSDWWKKGMGEFRSGVSYLREKLGEQVKTIGLTGYDITGTQGEYTKATSDESLDLALHRRGFETAVVDPAGRFVMQRERWWVHNGNRGSHYTDGVFMVPRDNFDLFVFVNRSFKGDPIEPWHHLAEW